MQLHLETNELNLLANLLMQHTSPQNDKLLEMVLARDLRFDSDELQATAVLLAAEKKCLKEAITQESDGVCKGKLQSKLALLDRVQERVDEACVMF